MLKKIIKFFAGDREPIRDNKLIEKKENKFGTMTIPAQTVCKNCGKTVNIEQGSIGAKCSSCYDIVVPTWREMGIDIEELPEVNIHPKKKPELLAMISYKEPLERIVHYDKSKLTEKDAKEFEHCLNLCCDAESIFKKTNSFGYAQTSLAYPFDRVTILARRMKDYELEILLCKRFLTLNAECKKIYQSEKCTYRAWLGSENENIQKRLPKAKELLKKQQAKDKSRITGKPASKVNQPANSTIKEISVTRKSKIDKQCEELGILIKRIEIPFDADSKKWICGRYKPKRVEQAVMLWLNKQGYQGTFYEIAPLQIIMKASCLDYVAEKSQILFEENYLSRTFTDQINLYKLDKSICRELIFNADDKDIIKNLEIILADNNTKKWYPLLKLDDVVFLLKNIDLYLYKKIVDYIFIDPQNNRNGFPDIFAFKGGKLNLFEVKTNDSLLNTQIRTYNNFIEPNSIPIKIIKVSKGKV